MITPDSFVPGVDVVKVCWHVGIATSRHGEPDARRDVHHRKHEHEVHDQLDVYDLRNLKRRFQFRDVKVSLECSYKPMYLRYYCLLRDNNKVYLL